MKKKKQARQNRERQERNGPDPIPANAPPLPKPKQYRDPIKELEKFANRVMREREAKKPGFFMDRVEVQQHLRGKDN